MQKASARPIWTGSINFGLVTIPVKLYTAVREKRLSFRSLHDQDKVPLKQKMYCPKDGKEVHPEHIIKGFEIEKDRFVIVHKDELEAVAPKSSKAIEIQDFVSLEEIDPLFFDRPYYVAPKPEGAKPYRLLLEAMTKKNKVGISKIVMFGKEYLAALRPLGDVLCIETMHFGDEVVSSESLGNVVDAKAKVDNREMKIAEQLIDSLTSDFDPSKYHDEYREKVMEMIHRKAEGEEIVTRPESDEPRGSKKGGGDLIAALEASLANAKGGKRGGGTVKAANGHSHGHANGHARRRKSA